MQIKITAIRYKDIPYSGGTFRKYEVKTDKTGDMILELRMGKERNAKIQMGQTVEGYIEDSFYTGKNGRVETKVLKAISAEYVYKLLLKLAPAIESTPQVQVHTPQQPPTPPVDDGFGTSALPNPLPRTGDFPTNDDPNF